MGEISLVSNGVLVSGRYGHGKLRKPVNPPLLALHSFEIYIISVFVYRVFAFAYEKNGKNQMEY